MKKILLLSVVLLSAACKKHHNCDCTIKQNVMGYTQNVNSKVQTPKMTKSEARDYCENMNATQNTGSTQQDVSCKLE